jgi:hypothetical protein
MHAISFTMCAAAAATAAAAVSIAGTTVSASTSLTIGTDCVGSFGDWGACSNVCGVGKRSKFYTIVSLLSDSLQSLTVCHNRRDIMQPLLR